MRVAPCRPALGAIALVGLLGLTCAAPNDGSQDIMGGGGTAGDGGTGGSTANTGGSSGGGGGSVGGGAPDAGTTGGAGATGAAGNRPDASAPTGAAGGGGSGGAAGRGGSGGTGGNGGNGGTGGTTGGGGSGPGGISGTIRIMPLGDSTTGSVCWRALLWQKLNQNGFSGRFDLVGSRRSDAGCTPITYDQDNEGHPGVLVTSFVNDADELTAGAQTLASVLTPHPADVVLLHFATNDVWSNLAPATILAAYSRVVDALRAANPRVRIFAAKLIPMNPINTATCSTCACPDCGARMVTFDAAIPAWAAGKTTATSPITVVDQWTGFNATAGADTTDGVHPNASGSTKIANVWYTALAPLF